MANTYQTAFNNLQSYPTYQGQENCVFSIKWVISGTDGNGHNAAAYGTTEIPYDPDDSYIPYEQLTFDDVMEWYNKYTSADTISEAQAAIDAEIALQVTPKTQTLPMPWNVVS
jgi:hypothetical protein